MSKPHQVLDYKDKSPFLVGILHCLDGTIRAVRYQNWGHGVYLDDVTPKDIERHNSTNL